MPERAAADQWAAKGAAPAEDRAGAREALRAARGGVHAAGWGQVLQDWYVGLFVAATLLDLKAARLLPQAEVEDEEDLALLEARDLLFARLLQYRAFKDVAAHLGETMQATGRMTARQAGLVLPLHIELFRASHSPVKNALGIIASQRQLHGAEEAFVELFCLVADQMADAFRAGFPGIAKRRTETEWLRVWESFVISYAKRRSNSDEE